jgi:hypothetical protein
MSSPALLSLRILVDKLFLDSPPAPTTIYLAIGAHKNKIFLTNKSQTFMGFFCFLSCDCNFIIKKFVT